MRKLVLALGFACACAVAVLAAPFFARAAFGISGEINVAGRLSKRAAQPNTVCFVIAKNMGGVPVAVKRYVNPVFPLRFGIKADDLLLPDSWKEPLELEVEINHHGMVGKLEAGDMFGKSAAPVRYHANRLSITVDKMIAVPGLLALDEDKGSYLFSVPAR